MANPPFVRKGANDGTLVSGIHDAGNPGTRMPQRDAFAEPSRRRAAARSGEDRSTDGRAWMG